MTGWAGGGTQGEREEKWKRKIFLEVCRDGKGRRGSERSAEGPSRTIPPPHVPRKKRTEPNPNRTRTEPEPSLNQVRIEPNPPQPNPTQPNPTLPGVISFLEWLQFCVPGAGRDPNSFNCAGRHGLRSCAAPADGTACNWCDKTYPKGSRMFSCRECDCDACLECAVAHLERCDTRIFCERLPAGGGGGSSPLCALCEEE